MSRVVVVQPWLVRDSWNGPESDGYSLHLSENDRRVYINRIIGNREPWPVPEMYVSPEPDSYHSIVDEETYQKLCLEKDGLRKGKDADLPIRYR